MQTTEFADVLHAVESRGLLARSYGYYLVRIGLLLLALAGIWVGFAFVGHHWGQLGLAAGLGIVLTQFLFFSHDAAHRQILRSGWANDTVALILGTGIGGLSFSWWKAKHARHHAAPNQIGKDPDIDPSIVHFYPAERLPKSRVLMALHQRQGWWFFPLLAVEALNLQVQSVQWLLTRRRTRRETAELIVLTIRVAALPALVFVFLPPGLAVLFLVVQYVLTGLYLGAAFAVSHIGMPIVAPTERLTFFARQLRSSRNVSGGRIASGLMGGLNYQIEHHLFPSMSRPNLSRARPIVRSFCEQREIEYHEVPVHRAWMIVIRHLNSVGLAGRQLYGCPTAGLLR